jgi:hypothetical protein
MSALSVISMLWQSLEIVKDYLCKTDSSRAWSYIIYHFFKTNKEEN